MIFYLILRLIENVKEVREELSSNVLFGTIDSWVIYNLSNKKLHITDVTNASRTYLMNLNTLKYEQEILKLIIVYIHLF